MMAGGDFEELKLPDAEAPTIRGTEVPVTKLIEEIMNFVLKKEKLPTIPAETVVFYRPQKIVDISLTNYPDTETARLGVRDKLREFEGHVKNIAGTKAVMEIRGEPHILVGSSDGLVAILFKSRPEWKATIIGNWLKGLADILAEKRIIPSPRLLAEVIRYIIRSQNKIKPDSYNKLIMDMMLRAERIYPILQGSPAVVRASLKAIAIKLSEHLASLGEAIVNQGLLTGEVSLLEIAEKLNAKLVDIVRLIIELEARGIVKY